MNAQPNEVAEKLPITVPIGLISGLVTGTTGLSASTMLSSLLIGFLGFSPYLAVGTTTLVSFVGNAISIIVLVLSGFVLHTSVVYIDWKLILTLELGSAVGAVLGAKLTTKINRKLLTFILAVMAIIPGIYLALSK